MGCFRYCISEINGASNLRQPPPSGNKDSNSLDLVERGVNKRTKNELEMELCPNL